LFLVEPWMVHNSGTPMPANIAGPERTAVGVDQLMPILDSTVGRNLRWISKHSSSLKQVAPRGYPNFWRIMDISPMRVLSLFSGAFKNQDWSVIASLRQKACSVVSRPLGARRTPSVCLPLVFSIQGTGVGEVQLAP
jgi:hypothetical protein